jgi:hypothetical protein
MLLSGVLKKVEKTSQKPTTIEKMMRRILSLRIRPPDCSSLSHLSKRRTNR